MQIGWQLPVPMSRDTLALFPDLVDRAPVQHTTGLLPSQKLEELISAGYVSASPPILPDQVQPSSIDLRFGPVAYRLPASFLPGKNSTVCQKLTELAVQEIDLAAGALFETNSVYLVPLSEEVHLPESISGRANPKSTTGRLDIFTRLLTDYGTAFENVPAGYKGKLYAEVVPLTFPVIVREGTRLNQLRLRRGDPPASDAMLWRLHEKHPIVYLADASPAEPVISDGGIMLGVDLAGTDDSGIIGYKARKQTAPIDLSKVGFYEVLDYWEPLYANPARRVMLDPGDFYILVSKQKLTIPLDTAAEMVPFDSSVGEFRIHYAGFFDPGFGWASNDGKGAHAVLEVRCHDVRSLLEDGQIVCRLVYEQLLAPPEKIYGLTIGSSYQSQRLALSKQFKNR